MWRKSISGPKVIAPVPLMLEIVPVARSFLNPPPSFPRRRHVLGREGDVDVIGQPGQAGGQLEHPGAGPQML